MTAIKEVRATTGYYIDKDGKKKNTYKTVGVLENGKFGEYIRLDASFNPAAIPRKEGSDSIILSLVEPREKRYDTKTPHGDVEAASAAPDFSDIDLSDMPF